MCGIVGGYWKYKNPNLEQKIDKALHEMHFRGPNDRGYEIKADSKGVVALGHTRLSIIDLSTAGHQPMVSSDGRYALVFNGEIYNYRELRDDLRNAGFRFVSDSDTEVLLYAWAHWGQDCLRRLDGMFAFVIHDRISGKFHCARDAFGIKPFFYENRDGQFLFASTQPALLALREGKPQLNWQRSYDYLVHADYDSNGQTFVAGVSHLPPGHFLEVDLATGDICILEKWWVPPTLVDEKLTFSDAAQLVRECFLQNIRLHLRSDVALGAALSGGIDSSAVVCAMRYLEPDVPIKTFSFIAAGSPLNEESWIDRVNSETRAQGFKVAVGPEDLLRDLDDMLLAQGEPFLSTSIYAQYCVFRLAKENGVTVTLDGQGADELMAGYSGYPGFRLLSLIESEGPFAAHRFARKWASWPGRNYRLAAMELGRVTLPDNLYAEVRRWLGRDFTPSWLNRELLADAGVNFMESRPSRNPLNRGRRVVEQLAKSLQQRGLPALLRHADRNSMRFSVESRVPFLTTRFAELLLSMPEDFLISRSGETKSVFRAAMRGIVPDTILDRKDKIGFATPEQEWLLKLAPVLREWIVQFDDSCSFINKKELLHAFDAIISGKNKFSWQVWRWVNFIRWHQVNFH